MSHAVLVKNLHKEKKYDVFFPYFENMGAYLAYKIELIWLTLTFKNPSFVAFLQRVYDNCFTFSSSGKALLKRGFDVSQR